MNLQDLISISIIPINIIPLILYFTTKDNYHLLIIVGLWTTVGLSEFIKHFIIKNASPRPQEALNCNLLCDDGNQGGKPGMPSSHAAASMFFFIIYWNYTTNPYFRAMLLSYYLLIIHSRYAKKCHTIPQLIVGSLFGMGTAAAVLKYRMRLL